MEEANIIILTNNEIDLLRDCITQMIINHPEKKEEVMKLEYEKLWSAKNYYEYNKNRGRKIWKTKKNFC